MNPRIFPLGDNALTVEFSSEISVEINIRVLKLARFFEENSFEGFIETVPAYSSLTIFYDPVKVRKTFSEFPSAFEQIKSFVENAVLNLGEIHEHVPRAIEIPVCFDTEFAPDLEFVASANNLSAEDVIRIFLSRTYRVFMLGFLPGFSYMGEVDAKIATPRKSSPRLKVPAGSVGIAGIQTGTYSLESPGGWQIIGQTPLELFTPEKAEPTFLRAGDTVKFNKIGKKTFLEIKEQRAK